MFLGRKMNTANDHDVRSKSPPHEDKEHMVSLLCRKYGKDRKLNRELPMTWKRKEESRKGSTGAYSKE